MHALRAVLLLVATFAMDKTEARPASEAPPLLYFKDGLFGVNFLGFHAAAGLKSLQDGGGLHAEAGTPFGQSAGAGLAGVFKSDGSLGGQLYAGATAGGNVKAAAGFGGELQNGMHPRAAGTLYSGASAGPAKAGSSMTGAISDEGSVNIVEKVADAAPRKVVKRDTSKFVRRSTTNTSDTVNEIKTVHYVRGHPVKFDKFFDFVDEPTLDPTPSPSTTKRVETPKPTTTNKPIVTTKLNLLPSTTTEEPSTYKDIEIITFASRNTDAPTSIIKENDTETPVTAENRPIERNAKSLPNTPKVVLRTDAIDEQDSEIETSRPVEFSTEEPKSPPVEMEDEEDKETSEHEQNEETLFRIPILSIDTRNIKGPLGALIPRISKRTYLTVAGDSPPPSNDGGSFLSSFFAPPAPVAASSQESVVQVRKSGTFFDDIFNIPISTLGAVSRFLSNTVPAKPATVEVQKTVTTH